MAAGTIGPPALLADAATSAKSEEKLMNSDQFLQQTEQSKPYQAPQIVVELELETQAGSPTGLPQLEDELETP